MVVVAFNLLPLQFFTMVVVAAVLIIVSQCCGGGKKKKDKNKKASKFVEADDSKYDTLVGLNDNIFVQQQQQQQQRQKQQQSQQKAGLTQMQRALQNDPNVSVQVVPMSQQQQARTMNASDWAQATQHFTAGQLQQRPPSASVRHSAQAPRDRGQRQRLDLANPNLSIQVLPHQTTLPSPTEGGTGETVWIVVPEPRGRPTRR